MFVRGGGGSGERDRRCGAGAARVPAVRGFARLAGDGPARRRVPKEGGKALRAQRPAQSHDSIDTNGDRPTR